MNPVERLISVKSTLDQFSSIQILFDLFLFISTYFSHIQSSENFSECSIILLTQWICSLNWTVSTNDYSIYNWNFSNRKLVNFDSFHGSKISTNRNKMKYSILIAMILCVQLAVDAFRIYNNVWVIIEVPLNKLILNCTLMDFIIFIESRVIQYLNATFIMVNESYCRSRTKDSMFQFKKETIYFRSRRCRQWKD